MHQCHTQTETQPTVYVKPLQQPANKLQRSQVIWTNGCERLLVPVTTGSNLSTKRWNLYNHKSQVTTTSTTTAILRPFIRDYPGEPVLEETFTHSHLCRSPIILYPLPPFTTIHSILPDQFTCPTVFSHNLCPSLLWSTLWSGTLHFVLHTFLHPIAVFFLQHMPISMQSALM